MADFRQIDECASRRRHPAAAPRQVLAMDTLAVHRPLRFRQIAICVRGVFLPAAGSAMAGCVHPAMVNVLAADGALSPEGPQRQRRTCAAG